MAKTIVYRQGDVALIPRPDLDRKFFENPSDPRKDALTKVVLSKSRVLRRGENGGVHALEQKSGSVIYEMGGVKYVISDEGVGVVHGEHHRVDVPPGVYEVRVQREAQGSGWRNVID